MNEGRLLKRLASETATYGLGVAVSRGLIFLALPFYSRSFSAAEYGTLNLVSAGILVTSIVLVLGLDDAAFRGFWAHEDGRRRQEIVATAAWVQVGGAAAAAGLVLAVSAPLGNAINGGDATMAVRLAGLTLPMAALSRVTVNGLRLRQKPKWAVGFTVGMAAAQLAAGVFCVTVVGLGIEGVFLGELAGGLAGCAISAWLMRDWLAPSLCRRAELPALLRFGMPLVPATLSLWVIALADRYFIAAFASRDQVGIYHAAATIAAGAALASGAFQQAWKPFALSISTRRGADRIYARALLCYAFAGSIVAAGAAVASPYLVDWLAPGYSGADQVVGLLALGSVISGGLAIAGIGATIAGSSRPIALGIGFGGVVNLLLNFALIPPFGLTGAAAATVASQVCAVVLVFASAHRLHPVAYPFARAAVLGVISLAAVVAARSIGPGGAEALILRGALFLTAAGAAAAIAGVPGLAASYLRRRPAVATTPLEEQRI